VRGVDLDVRLGEGLSKTAYAQAFAEIVATVGPPGQPGSRAEKVELLLLLLLCYTHVIGPSLKLRPKSPRSVAARAGLCFWILAHHHVTFNTTLGTKNRSHDNDSYHDCRVPPGAHFLSSPSPTLGLQGAQRRRWRTCPQFL